MSPRLLLRRIVYVKPNETRKTPGGGEICPTLTAGEPQSITPLEALRRLGIYRLSARIFDLRERGHNIKTTTQAVTLSDGDKAEVARYTLFI